MKVRCRRYKVTDSGVESLILFLFFNANAELIPQRIDRNDRAIAFGDCTAWIVGDTAADNMDHLNTIVQHPTAQESRSGVSFEGDKTTFIHLRRNSRQFAEDRISDKGEEDSQHVTSRSYI